LSVAYVLRNAMSYDVEILHADTYGPRPKHLVGFMTTRVVVTKKWHFSKTACSFAAMTSVSWLAGCMQGRYSHLESVSLS